MPRLLSTNTVHHFFRRVIHKKFCFSTFWDSQVTSEFHSPRNLMQRNKIFFGFNNTPISSPSKIWTTFSHHSLLSTLNKIFWLIKAFLGSQVITWRTCSTKSVESNRTQYQNEWKQEKAETHQQISVSLDYFKTHWKNLAFQIIWRSNEWYHQHADKATDINLHIQKGKSTWRKRRNCIKWL